MKKRILALLMTGAMVLSAMGCGAQVETEQTSDITNEEVALADTVEASEEASQEVGIANPWRDITYEEANATVGKLFKAPEGATNVQWSICDSVADPSGFPGPLVQLTYDFDHYSVTAREQATSEDAEDISGMYYDWTATDETNLGYWGYGKMPAKFYRYISDEEWADLCTFYDVELGAAYSFSVVAKDLDGFDIQAVVESMFDQETQYGYNPLSYMDEHEPLDITGCDTFTQIVDKLEPGFAYANATIDGVDVLLVTDYTFHDPDTDKDNAIEAEIFAYGDGVPYLAGYVSAGGTAYPLSITDGKLFVGGNHFIKEYAFMGQKYMMVLEGSWVDYDSDGNGTYYAHSDVREYAEAEADCKVADDSIMTDLFDRYMNGEVIDFQVVQ